MPLAGIQRPSRQLLSSKAATQRFPQILQANQRRPRRQAGRQELPIQSWSRVACRCRRRLATAAASGQQRAAVARLRGPAGGVRVAADER
jgi:hypothetical protein